MDPESGQRHSRQLVRTLTGRHHPFRWVGNLEVETAGSKSPRIRLKQLGSDGVFTFLLSHMVLLATGGLLLGYLFGRVIQLAIHAPCHTGGARTCLVFGMKLGENGTLPEDYLLRLERVRKIQADASSTRFILLGGRTGEGLLSEAAAGKRYLNHHSPAFERVELEESSLHTQENIKNVMDMGVAGKPVSLLTNRYHLARCMYMARGFGLNANPCAAEERLKATPGQALLCAREAYFLHWYVVGRAWACLTSNRTMLARIGECQRSR